MLVIGIGAAALFLTVVTAVSMPPKAAPAVPPAFELTWPVVRGAYHVHSSRSDGTGSLDEIAGAAARAGLQFVILTDHGTGTRPPEPPAYRAGVLCIDGVEISTGGGHYVALGLPETPYPLGGQPQDVIDDVRRFGGFGVIAHPGSPKPSLQWADWGAPFDALEWLNADSEWRDEFWGSLGSVLLTYSFRPVETLGGLLDRPRDVLQRWDALHARRRVPALAGADAHARLGFRQGADPYQDRVIARLPSYDVSFRAFVNHVILNESLTGDAARDAALVIGGIREGRVFTSIDSLAGLSAFEVVATSGSGVARPGEYLDVAGPVAITARIAGPAGTSLTVVRDGAVVYEVAEPALRLDLGTAPGAYRVEAHLPLAGSGTRGDTGHRLPWALSNPIYVGLRGAHASAAAAGDAAAPAIERTAIATAAWQAESSAGSTSSLAEINLEDGTPALQWRYAIAGGARGEQYAAMRFPADAAVARHDRLQLRARSHGPMRLWAQLRAPGAAQGERWGQTFYIDRGLTSVELRFADFRPLGATSSARPPLDRIDALLLVVDTLNSQPGAAGTVEITDLWLAR